MFSSFSRQARLELRGFWPFSTRFLISVEMEDDEGSLDSGNENDAEQSGDDTRIEEGAPECDQNQLDDEGAEANDLGSGSGLWTWDKLGRLGARPEDRIIDFVDTTDPIALVDHVVALGEMIDPGKVEGQGSSEEETGLVCRCAAVLVEKHERVMEKSDIISPVNFVNILAGRLEIVKNEEKETSTAVNNLPGVFYLLADLARNGVFIESTAKSLKFLLASTSKFDGKSDTVKDYLSQCIAAL